MKIHIGWVLLIAVVACLTGGLVANLNQTISSTQRLSLVGQTLTNLSHALEAEKEKTGIYPDSIERLVIKDSGGDFSALVLKEVTYQKTKTGYIAFVGIPNVSYKEPGQSVITR